MGSVTFVVAGRGDRAGRCRRARVVELPVPSRSHACVVASPSGSVEPVASDGTPIAPVPVTALAVALATGGRLRTITPTATVWSLCTPETCAACGPLAADVTVGDGPPRKRHDALVHTAADRAERRRQCRQRLVARSGQRRRAGGVCARSSVTGMVSPALTVAGWSSAAAGSGGVEERGLRAALEHARRGPGVGAAADRLFCALIVKLRVLDRPRRSSRAAR